QVVIFIFEYALATLLIKWGIKPSAMIGYSFGEYVAACLSGVFSLQDALKVVVNRGRILQNVSPGAMLSVPLPRWKIIPLLKTKTASKPGDGLSLAIDNGPSCIVAGSEEAVNAFETRMKEGKLMCMRVPMARALHSKMMEPLSTEFKRIFTSITLSKPKIPYISNVTGTWIKDGEALDPAYWTKHLQQTVQFANGMKELLKEPGSLFLEIGPGRDLSNLATRHVEEAEKAALHNNGKNSGEQQDSTANRLNRVLNLVRQPAQKVAGVYLLLNRVGRLWL
ncbi:MAG: acyltransferase domain-containing protein, partial [bacterium]|nr:acyltransferase domain-containing protein [bacterium]